MTDDIEISPPRFPSGPAKYVPATAKVLAKAEREFEAARQKLASADDPACPDPVAVTITALQQEQAGIGLLVEAGPLAVADYQAALFVIQDAVSRNLAEHCHALADAEQTKANLLSATMQTLGVLPSRARRRLQEIDEVIAQLNES